MLPSMPPSGMPLSMARAASDAAWQEVGRLREGAKTRACMLMAELREMDDLRHFRRRSCDVEQVMQRRVLGVADADQHGIAGWLL